MPSFSFDISDEVRNIVDSAIKYDAPPDFNAGQAAAWADVTCDISGEVTVRIAGRLVDVTTNVSVQCTGADYISGAVAGLSDLGDMMADSIEKGNYFLTDELIAFKQL